MACLAWAKNSGNEAGEATKPLDMATPEPAATAALSPEGADALLAHLFEGKDESRLQRARSSGGGQAGDGDGLDFNARTGRAEIVDAKGGAGGAPIAKVAVHYLVHGVSLAHVG